MDYCNQSQVIQLSQLLDRWPTLPVEKALQLLDYAYPDENVRKFAVRCLRQVMLLLTHHILKFFKKYSKLLSRQNYSQHIFQTTYGIDNRDLLLIIKTAFV